MTFIQSLLLLLLWAISCSVSAGQEREFVQCLLHHDSKNSSSFSQVVYTASHNSSSYFSVLNSRLQNLRFQSPDTPKPLVILTPVEESQVQTAIECSQIHGLQIRIRSGGHDFEALSSVSRYPFFILDLINFKSVSVDAEEKTAWVGAGVTLGELYYAITQVKDILAFPGGYYPSVGCGGFISGGGYGPLVRKHGLAADNVLDAVLVDAGAQILDRKSMGEDLFWAIRGGVGASFGVILHYKLQLVDVPSRVSAFSVSKTMEEEGATDIVYKWQSVAPKLAPEIMLSLQLVNIDSTKTGKTRPTVLASFHALYLGAADGLLSIITEEFPELGVTWENCTSLRFIEYYAYFFGVPLSSTIPMLQGRILPGPRVYFKSKSDYVQKPIPVSGLKEIWDHLGKIEEARAARMEWSPFGGRMDEIPEHETPYPHRTGNLFIIYQKVEWHEMDPEPARERLEWEGQLHGIIGRYVASNPRSAYANYRDLDLGVNELGSTDVRRAKAWALPYFKNNFERLVRVKSEVDPNNYFWNEQSIPTLFCLVD